MTETEITEGLLNAQNVDEKCVWLRRKIKDIEKQDASYLLSKFIGNFIWFLDFIKLNLSI